MNCFRIIFCFRCKKYTEDQNIEIGQWVNGVLTPDDIGLWQRRQDNMRNYFLGRYYLIRIIECMIFYSERERKLVDAAVNEVESDDLLHQYDNINDTLNSRFRRRAAVFYVDQGVGSLAYIQWWLYTWKFIGLNHPDQGFDLVMMTHPAAVSSLPPECLLVNDNFHINFSSPGQCWYKPYLGKLTI